MPNEMDAAADLGYQANRLARLLRAAVAKEVAHLGITARQGAVILQLAEAGTLPMGALAERLGIDRPTLTGVVDRLIRDGWIETTVNAADRRSRLVNLSPMAIERLPQLTEASGNAAGAALSALGQGDSAHLLQLLDRASSSLEASLTPGEPKAPHLTPPTGVDRVRYSSRSDV